MATKKTDNHYTMDKIMLRVNNLPEDKNTLTVLDCFGGRGVIWAGVKKISGIDIKRTAIDKRNDINYFHLHGDNEKVMAGIDLSKYDVIDLDAYGIPIAQLGQVFDSDFSGDVFVTAIQTMHGGLPNKLAEDLGFPKDINKKAPSLLARRGWQLLKEWLAINGVKKITHRSKDRKHYLHFRI